MLSSHNFHLTAGQCQQLAEFLCMAIPPVGDLWSPTGSLQDLSPLLSGPFCQSLQGDFVGNWPKSKLILWQIGPVFPHVPEKLLHPLMPKGQPTYLTVNDHNNKTNGLVLRGTISKMFVKYYQSEQLATAKWSSFFVPWSEKFDQKSWQKTMIQMVKRDEKGWKGLEMKVDGKSWWSISDLSNSMDFPCQGTWSYHAIPRPPNPRKPPPSTQKPPRRPRRTKRRFFNETCSKLYNSKLCFFP